jgi:hypothetical protein
MRLSKLEVGAVVEDPIAFTELRMVFENPEPKALKGELEIELPPGAQVTRFATKEKKGWREAEVVERSAPPARPSLKVPSKPSLGDGVDGRVFRATIPRIEGRARQEVVLSYSQAFAEAGEEYRVRLAGLGKVGKLDADILVTDTYDDPTTSKDERGKQRVVELDDAGRAPRKDLVIQLPRERRTGVRNGKMVVARVNPLSHDHPDPVHGITLLFDTSASRAVGFDRQVDRVGELLESVEGFVGGHVPLRILAFDQAFRVVYEGRLGSFEATDLEELRQRKALGASNLRAAIDYVGQHRGMGYNRVILVSDGVATAGQIERSKLEDAVKGLADAGVVRFDVVTEADPSNPELLTRLARALKRPGLVLDAADDPDELTRRLARTVTDNVRIDVPGARWHYPEQLDGVQSSDEVLVYAQVEADEELEIRCSSAHDKDLVRRVPLTLVEPKLVEHAWMGGKVAFLADGLKHSGGQPLADRRKAWERIVKLSTEHRVLNEWTTLQVARKEDAANTDSDILVGGPLGVQILRRDVVMDESADRPVMVPRLPKETLGVDQLLLLAEADPEAATVELAKPAVLPGAAASDPEQEQRDILDTLHAKVQHRLPVPKSDVGAPPPAVVRSKLGGSEGLGPIRKPADAYSGNLLAVMNLLSWGRVDEATQMATAWREAEPGNVMALVALGESLEANDAFLDASRVYGSIIDLFPDRADMRRFAGQRLERLGPVGTNLALDTYQRAREQHPDQPSSHRLYSFALLRAGEPERAFDVMARALAYGYREEDYGPVEKIIREDLGLIGASWIKQRPADRPKVMRRLRQLGAPLEARPSLRFILTWETSGNDVDLHVRDQDGHHAFYESPVLDSGGMLYGDVKEGFGPEAFTISGEPLGYPYGFQVHYYARGPLGYGMGKLEIIEHDGDGLLKFDERPFVVTKDRAYVDLGLLGGPL